ncbi:MAG TPA: hypothetical protein VMU84_01555 [Thermoanaerobaculia bacterium]|nr:hypothetical protein [Thermoanaerobaculia bacterium]
MTKRKSDDSKPSNPIWKSVTAATALAGALLPTSISAKPTSPNPLEQRIIAVRRAFDEQKAPADARLIFGDEEKPVKLAQWLNWGNWGNWNNWRDWNNWNNWSDWSDWGKFSNY